MTASAIAHQLGARIGVRDPAQLTGALAAALDEIRRRWPAVEIVPERLAAAIAARIAAEAPEVAIRRLHIADIFLADACVHADPRAYEAFTELVAQSTARPVSAITRQASDIDDVQQVVCERLLLAANGPPRIAQYNGAVSLRAWIRVIGARIAIDGARRSARERPLEEALVSELAAASVGPELAELKAKYRARFSAAVEAAIGGLSERDRGVLRFTIQHEVTAEQIGRLYGVHRVTVARWIRRIRDALTAAIVTHLCVEQSELESMLRMIRSQVSLSVQRILASSPDAR